MMVTCQLRQVIFYPLERSSALASSDILDMEALYNIRRSPHYFQWLIILTQGEARANPAAKVQRCTVGLQQFAHLILSIVLHVQ